MISNGWLVMDDEYWMIGNGWWVMDDEYWMISNGWLVVLRLELLVDQWIVLKKRIMNGSLVIAKGENQ